MMLPDKEVSLLEMSLLLRMINGTPVVANDDGSGSGGAVDGGESVDAAVGVAARLSITGVDGGGDVAGANGRGAPVLADGACNAK